MPAEVVTSENLAEFNAARMPQAPEPKEEPKAEAKEEPKPKVEEEEIDEEGETKPDKPKRKAGIEGRFSELSAKARHAQEERDAAIRERDEARAKAREFEERLAPKAKKEEDPEPKAAEFTDPFEYADKRSEWAAREALRNRDKAEATAKSKAEAEKTQKAWQDRISKAKEAIPDFEETLADSDLAVSDDVRDAIIESELGPQILHHLATNPDLAEKINGMSAKQALKEIGRLEVKLEPKDEEKEEKPAKPKREPLPEPITPVKAKATASNDTEGLSYAEYKARRMSGKT